MNIMGCVHIRIVMYCFLTAVVPVTGPPLELTSESINDDSVYHEQVVILTCITRGSPTLAWSSNDYIGSGLLVEFLLIHDQGETRSYNNGTIATLTYKRVDGSIFVLESTLRIQASRMYSTSTVSCYNVGQDVRDTITFHVLGKKNFFSSDLLSMFKSSHSYPCSGGQCFFAKTICLPWRQD